MVWKLSIFSTVLKWLCSRPKRRPAKASGFRLLGSIANDDVRARVVIGSALRKAIQDSELELFYQPQISTKNNMLYGVEALSRWHHPTLGTIPPSRFIPIAEETAQIEAIGLWSLEQACIQIVKWDKIGLHVPIVSVNLSAAHFSNPTLTENIVNLLEHYRLSPNRLTIEITEGGMMQQNAETMTTLTALRDIGVGLSLDDFGTGFSSLSRISHLPLTEIKIDRSFIINFEKDVSSIIVTEAAINIGKRLGVHVVTEGVEDTFQETRLRAMGCDVMQGYLFARPMPPSDLLHWMQTRPILAPS
ncbi:putative bifunctional diguanylate cyclase/phosphodiesterase [Acetobacter ghanensis]|nr:EAL domain-containing protein [Acetobacter ghanensis]